MAAGMADLEEGGGGYGGLKLLRQQPRHRKKLPTPSSLNNQQSTEVADVRHKVHPPSAHRPASPQISPSAVARPLFRLIGLLPAGGGGVGWWDKKTRRVTISEASGRVAGGGRWVDGGGR
ncbi:resuscitation-promoting factor RpfD [Striga asiatica]|uniref:Resuscitation-promoting factor RpfD n=1 Tax=Striga asiatica TaxID=4170 RepID=A0A5A7PME3_STRAF|nr:resuscitation-promoting factor RpfD [Striga asiatica]